jgi:hypothetical protein
MRRVEAHAAQMRASQSRYSMPITTAVLLAVLRAFQAVDWR